MGTGAKCNVLTRNTYYKLNISALLEKPEAMLGSYSGHKIVNDGMTTTPVLHDGLTYSVKFYVVNRYAPNILGPDTCLKLNLVRSMNTISSQKVTY